jgi:chromosome segregation ATPase
MSRQTLAEPEEGGMGRNKMVLWLAGSLAVLSPARTAAQQPAPDTLEVLLSEVRLLRQTLEKQVALQARAQLVVGRLALQDQRLARARSELQRAESDAQGLSSQRTQIQTALAELQRSPESVDPSRQADVEREQRMMVVRLQEIEKALGAAEGRRSRAVQAASAEEARYEELERWFDDLDRELTRVGR